MTSSYRCLCTVQPPLQEALCWTSCILDGVCRLSHALRHSTSSALTVGVCALQLKRKLRAVKVKLEQLKPRGPATLDFPSHPRHEQAEPPQGSWQPAEPCIEAMLPSLSPSSCQALHPASLQNQCASSRKLSAAPPNGPAMRQAASLSNIDEEDYTLCVVCMEAATQIKFQPCAHAVTCKLCAGKILLQTGECPMCRCQLSALDVLARNA